MSYKCRSGFKATLSLLRWKIIQFTDALLTLSHPSKPEDTSHGQKEIRRFGITGLGSQDLLWGRTVWLLHNATFTAGKVNLSSLVYPDRFKALGKRLQKPWGFYSLFLQDLALREGREMTSSFEVDGFFCLSIFCTDLLSMLICFQSHLTCRNIADEILILTDSDF